VSWCRAADGGVALRLHVQPGARVTEIVGMHGDALKVRLAAPPVDGKANACLVDFLADRLGIAKSSVSIVGGETSRTKRVRVDGVSEELVASRLGATGRETIKPTCRRGPGGRR
jgi:uncharacterized protein (TIGR00251 family)